MKKLLATLIAGFVVSSAFAQAPAPVTPATPAVDSAAPVKAKKAKKSKKHMKAVDAPAMK